MKLRVKVFSLFLALFTFLFFNIGSLSRFVSADTLYTIHRGDTLWGIARTYHISIPVLKESNHLTSDLIYVHQNLHIPKHAPMPPHVAPKPYVVYHTVHQGDTLWKLAAENHLSVSCLASMNHLHSTMIHPGQKLRVYEGSESTWKKIQLKKYQTTGIPLQLIPVYQAAGQKYGVPWTVLAAIHHQETHFSTGRAVSYAGAQGPMQFMPSTFRYYGVCAPGHTGAPDINNVSDAIYTCAHMLKSVGYTKNPTRAIFMYNHSMHYVEAVVRTAQHFAV